MKITMLWNWLPTLFARLRWLPAFKWLLLPRTCYLLKTVVIVVYLLTYNFIYFFSDFSHELPAVAQWDDAAYYMIAPVLDFCFFLFALTKERIADSFHFKAFCYLLLFAAFRVFFEIYTIVFGESINAKYVSSSLFFVTSVCVLLVALSSGHKDKPKLK